MFPRWITRRSIGEYDVNNQDVWGAANVIRHQEWQLGKDANPTQSEESPSKNQTSIECSIKRKEHRNARPVGERTPIHQPGPAQKVLGRPKGVLECFLHFWAASGSQEVLIQHHLNPQYTGLGDGT
jgi:hypothetical protein